MNTEQTEQSNHKGGAPRKFTPEQIAEIYAALEDYIDGEPDPMIVRFCVFNPVALKYKVLKDNILDMPEFEHLVKFAQQKEEIFLVDAGMETPRSLTMSIFRLKQPRHGYRDRFEQDITTQGEKISFVNTVPRPGKAKE